ncbi:MAG TPA: SDR family NAD(P)-dependent oxidoreductase [Polyangiaceae bacterium]|nr:SDR family NAD(P)-dependent oxidoreductase [Polyangiaceae bacterium]
MQQLLIVGASRGLGEALVRLALERGAHVTAVVRSREALAPLETVFAQLTVLTADVRVERDLERAAHQVTTSFDVIVYNAAVHLEHDRLDVELCDPEVLTTTFDVNATGAVRTVKWFRRSLKPKGVLVFISSEAGGIAAAWRTSEYGYCMSKAALNMFSKLIANREAALVDGARVVALHPGWVRTAMGGQNADLSADDSANAILDTIHQRLEHPGPTFVDRFGAPMDW